MKIKGKIDNYFIKSLCLDENKDYKVKNYIPIDLLIPERFDLVPKIKYVESISNNYNTNFFEKIYLASIEAFSEGSYSEPGNKNKNNYNKFIITFKKLINEIKKTGIDLNKSVVPVGNNGAIIDGAHRTAISIFYNLTIPTIKIPNSNPCYDYNFFKKRLLSLDYLDYLCIEYAKLKDDVYCLCLWPKCNDKQIKLAREKINNTFKVISERKIDLTYNGLKNFMIEIYKSQSWIGTPYNKHNGVISKLDSCYDKNGSLTLFIIQEKDLNKIIRVKEEIRSIIGLDNHSIHSTDTKEETINMLSLLLNKNSVNFLNNANIDEYPKLYDKINDLKIKLIKEKIDINDIIIDGSLILSVYGLRENNDIDFMVAEKISNKASKKFEIHNSFSSFYNKTIDDIIYNPNNYFYFYGFKFVSIDLLKEMKNNRLENKDKMDLELISNMSNSNKNFNTLILKLRFRIRKFLRNLLFPVKRVIIIILKKIGLFNYIKKVKDFLKKR